MRSNDITADSIRCALDYDSETGEFKWRGARKGKMRGASTAGYIHRSGYVLISFNYRKYLAHRLAWLHFYGELPRLDIDHIDGNRSNNAIKNLRDVTVAVNKQNLRKALSSNMTCGLLGATFNKCAGKWQSQIGVDGKYTYLGLFDTAEEAHQAYLTAKRQVHVGCTI